MSKGVSVELDEDGFLKDPHKWNVEVATYIAREQFGIELEDVHWKVVRFFLEYYQKWGTLPMIRTVRTNLNLTSEQLDEFVYVKYLCRHFLNLLSNELSFGYIHVSTI